MKKLFDRKKRSKQEWEGYDESEYDWDSADNADESREDAEYYEESDGEVYYQDSYYAEDEDTDGMDYAAHEADEGGDPYYGMEDPYYEMEEGETGVGADYADTGYENEALERMEDYYAEETGGYDESMDEVYDAEDLADLNESDNGAVRTGRVGGRRNGFLAKLQRGLAAMGIMDRVILVTGVGVLILALITGSVYVSSRIVDRQVSSFASVGTQLDGIDTIGEDGLLAIADAQMARLATAEIIDEYSNTGYDEEEYEREVTVGMEFVSIQRDLKIKFVNERTSRLIANVPFAVSVTDPSGNTSIWSDDDMDGIIYKKDITPGDYQIVMEPLTNERYADYVISTAAERTTVKKDIAYEKVNVENEVKTESEVNASKEDTKINETQVESVLPDTVEWVESKVVSASYKEVDKSAIPDPMTLLALNGTFLRSTETVSGNEGGDDQTTIEKPIPGLQVSPGSVTVVSGGTVSASASASGIPSGCTASYAVSGGNADVATASIDSSSGAITITGVAAGTTQFSVTVSYVAADGATVSSTPATIGVTVTGNKALTLDRNAVTVFISTPVTVNAAIVNAVNTDPSVTAESSDTGVATVSVDKRAVTISGVKTGTATITISFTENNETVQATCTVTVKEHPKNNTTEKLKDANGTQLYVNENGTYREAVYADFYNTSLKFYLRGETQYTGWQTINGKVYFFTADGKKVTGEQVIQGAKYNFASDGSLVQGNGMLGIDVSKWNGNIDWNAVKNSGISYVIIRCGYRGSSAGSLIEDPKFIANIKGATAAGLKVGIYFFTQAIDEREAVEEASMVLAQVRNYTISYPIFLDVESSGGRADSIDRATRTAVCRAFCQTIQNEGYTAGIYANKTWLNSKIDVGALSAYKIWLAQYAATPTYTGRYDLWQYRSTGSVSGISGDVDMNLSYLGY